jgi:hypothetical protein
MAQQLGEQMPYCSSTIGIFREILEKKPALGRGVRSGLGVLKEKSARKQKFSATPLNLFPCLYRTLTQAEGIWDYQIKGIHSGNCRFVATSGGSWGYNLLRLAETILKLASWCFVGCNTKQVFMVIGPAYPPRHLALRWLVESDFAIEPSSERIPRCLRRG